MRFPEIAYMSWAKAMPKARSNMARSGIDPCPPGLLRLSARDLATHHPAGYGWPPLLQAIGRRYGVSSERVLTVSGGTSLANWVACAAALHGAAADAEVIVERPTYEPLLRIPESMGGTIRRLDRWFEEGWGIDPDRFASIVTRRTRLAIVTNLHNPSGARLDPATLREMARALERVGGFLLVDEVYLECLSGARQGTSSVHAGPNVIATNSLTKAYGLDGLRAGWILGPRRVIARAGKIHDLLGVNGVAPGEGMTLAALRNMAAIRRRAHAILRPNLERVTRFLARETRLSAHVPPGGNVLFARLPAGLDSGRFARRLLRHHGTLVVPGRFFESPRFVRISFGCSPKALARGLASLSRALDDLGYGQASRGAPKKRDGRPRA